MTGPRSRGGRGGAAGVALALWLAGCGERPGAQPGPAGEPAAGPWLVEVTVESGLDFVHFNGMSGEHYMAEVTGPGGALLDYDRDGDLDAYLVQGAMLGPGKSLADALGAPPAGGEPIDRLWRNDGAAAAGAPVRFVDVTPASGIHAAGYGMGVAVGDYDRDGWPDLYVTNLGPNQLLRNRGDGTFRDVTAEAGAGDDRWSVPATFVDYDRDGWLDLFVGNYVDFPFEDQPVCRDMTGAPDYCGPDNFSPQADRLLRNRGDGTFEDVTATAGLTGGFGPALGVVGADFDADGWPDLYVANDQKANNLWRNQGDGTFRDDALLAGASLNEDGRAEASMGVDAADFDGDGDLDLFLTHLVTETNTLYRNDGAGNFRDVTRDTGLGPPSRPYTSFGTGFLDADGDGWLDLVVLNGAVKKIEALARAGDPFPLHQPNQLFRNRGGGGFEDATQRAGPALARSEVSRGAAFGDVDRDGRTDLLLINNNAPARLLLNRAGDGRPWLGLRLETGAGGDVPGGRASVRLTDGRVLWRRVRLDGSYASASDPRLLFGLGDGGAADEVRAFWPDGGSVAWRRPAARRYLALRPGAEPRR